MPPLGNMNNQLRQLKALTREVNALSSGTVRNKVNRIQGTRKIMNPVRSAFNQAVNNYNTKQRNKAKKNQNMYNRALYLIRTRANKNRNLMRQQGTRRLINNGRGNQDRNNL